MKYTANVQPQFIENDFSEEMPRVMTATSRPRPLISFPNIIKGERIDLEVLTSDAKRDIHDVVNMVNENSDFAPVDRSCYADFRNAQRVIEQREGCARRGLLADYFMRLAKNGNIIGGVILLNFGDGSVSAAYYVDKKYRRQGYVSEALKMIEPVVTDMGFKSIVLEIADKNVPSVITAVKNGYIFKETGYPMKDFIKELPSNER